MSREEQVNGLGLEEWKAWVSRTVEELSTLLLSDLADQDFLSDWRSGLAADEAARRYLGELGWAPPDEPAGEGLLWETLSR